MRMSKPKHSLTRTELLARVSKILMRMLPFTTALPEIYDLINDISRQRPELDKKILRAHQSLKETSSLLSELESGLKERTATLEKIKADYDQYSKLAKVEENKAQALIQQIELTISKGRGKERLISLFLNLVAGIVIFVLGVLLGPALTRWFGAGVK